MSTNRKAAEDFILKYIGKLVVGGTANVELYKTFFASLSDKEFGEFMKGIQEGSKRLSIIVPNFAKERMTVENNLALAKELGHEFFERIWMVSEQTGRPYLTPIRYLVVDLPLRRQAQLLKKKISIPEHNRSIDEFSGQPTGDSKGSKISYPETQILAALDLDKTLEELLKVRGGDLAAFNASNKQINRTGGFSLDAIKPESGEVTATTTLRTLLTSMHLSTTL